MTRIAWGIMVLALAAVLMISASPPAAAQQSSDQSMTQNEATQMPSDQGMTGEQTMPQPEVTTPDVTPPPATAVVPVAPSARIPVQPTAPGEYPNVAGLVPFSPEADFMSIPGYLRWQVFRSQGTWLTYAEARRIVIAQGGRIYRAA